MREKNVALDNKTVLVTGAGGFIGYYLTRELLRCGCRVIGFDSMNDYYEVSLKEYRVAEIEKMNGSFTFIRGNMADKELVAKTFMEYKPEIVVNLAAQAGVRYSIDHPDVYIESNLIGFYNILEACRHNPVEHLVYASSSSVYGNQEKTPFSTTDDVSKPISLYAATKKSNELMAYTYAHLYGIPATGLRFFTVYGPYGRPDMAYFKFTNAIMKGESIKIFNNGDMLRDFTYVDDIVEGIVNLLEYIPRADAQGAKYKVYNIGNNKPENLMHFIEVLETCLGKKAKKEFLPMQAGDVYQTFADVDDLVSDVGFKPKTGIEEGLKRFAEWWKEYYSFS